LLPFELICDTISVFDFNLWFSANIEFHCYISDSLNSQKTWLLINVFKPNWYLKIKMVVFSESCRQWSIQKYLNKYVNYLLICIEHRTFTSFLYLTLLGTMIFISGQFSPIISICLLIIFFLIMADLPLLRFFYEKISKDKYKTVKQRNIQSQAEPSC